MVYLQIFCLTLVSQYVLGLTVDAPNGSEVRPPSLLLERFDQSGLDFHVWVERMIDDGHLLTPAGPNSLLVVRQGSWSTRLKNVACSKVQGNRELVQSTQKHFCNFVQQAERYKAREMKDKVTKALCPDGEPCTYALTAVFDFFNITNVDKVDDFFNICNQLFDQLNNACPGTGGVAEASIVKNGNEVEKGKIEASWTQEDGNCTPSKTVSCHEHRVEN